MGYVKPYQSLWSETIATRPADLRLRRELIAKLASVLEARRQRDELTLRETAALLGVSHPRIADLLAQRAERFSLDRLVLFAELLQLNVRLRATRRYATERRSEPRSPPRNA